MGQTESGAHHQTDSGERHPTGGFDRRALLRRAATAGAVGWTVPVILTSEVASAGVFTAKCAPGTTTATVPTFSQTVCNGSGTTIIITISFSGPCPCGGAGAWCAQKNSPTPTVASASSVLTFSVNVPIGSTVALSGKVAHRCTDRDGDTQYAVYNWAMSATDNGGACAVANSVSAVTLSNRTLVTSASCPSLTAAALPAVAAAVPNGAPRPSR